MTGQSHQATARSWLEVDLGALRRNAAAAASRAGAPLLPMVKADAYGVGAVAVVRALEPERPWGYGVATVEEGGELRRAGVERPIVVFTPLLLADFPAARAARLTPVLGHAAAIASWTGAGTAPWHLGIDTGMSRAGVRWDKIGEVLDVARAAPPEGACTHFHSAELDDDSAAVQARRFDAAVAALGTRPPLLHAENSAAIARGGRSRWDLVRPGIFLYGVDSYAAAPLRAEPVVALRSRIVEVREVGAGESVSYDATYHAPTTRRIATAALGYADGYRRALSNRGTALVRGRPAPVAGLVTMDMTMLDVTGLPCEPGDVATFVGADGDRSLSVAEVAERAELSPYELLVGFRLRAPRRYQGVET